jgi:aspartate-semialdehyde dehydrogenase
MEKKIRVGIVGATGMVGQRFISLLEGHPWFTVTAVAASKNSAGKPYREAVEGRWKMMTPVPPSVADLPVYAAEEGIENMKAAADFVFCAVDMDKPATKALEEAYAAAGVPVVSANSANRWTEDVPMLMPEVNPEHVAMIDIQRKKRGWERGFIAVKPNCSIQSYVPILSAWKAFEPERVIVTTFQAISGAGKDFKSWPEMVDNVIPLIGGEEEKSEKEPMKIWATMDTGTFVIPSTPSISATCIRVPVTDGHMASVSVSFKTKPSKDELIAAIRNFKNPLAGLGLPSAPEPFITYFDEENRPQTGVDRDLGKGMGISAGRLREDPILGWKFVALSHNTIRGAAGGAILTAELLAAKGYL